MDNPLPARQALEHTLTIRSEVGQAANEAAARSAFADYRSRKAESTIRRQDAALALFSQYLAHATGGRAPAGDALRQQPHTPQGRRDEVLIRLMLDLGLRVGEVAGLTVGDVDLQAGELRFYRSKVDKVQTHRPTIKIYYTVVAFSPQAPSRSTTRSL